ncbi:MAG TPA: alpha/beta hydrolase, partial [Terriglobales bacterium]|nr:alpha/beta hydrolase [Terriglobales bacterium]
AELDIHCKQLIVHGAEDDIVPVQMSRDYAKLKLQKAENISLLELPKTGHFEVVDPDSKVWPEVQKAVAALV